MMPYYAKKEENECCFLRQYFAFRYERIGTQKSFVLFGDKMGYRQIHTDDLCVLGKRSYRVLWKRFSCAMNQSNLEAGERTPGEGNFIKGRCTNLSLHLKSVDKCQEKSVLSFCDAWSSCLVRYKPGCRHPGHLAETNTTVQVLQVRHVHECFTRSRPNYLGCCLYH